MDSQETAHKASDDHGSSVPSPTVELLLHTKELVVDGKRTPFPSNTSTLFFLIQNPFVAHTWRAIAEATVLASKPVASEPAIRTRIFAIKRYLESMGIGHFLEITNLTYTWNPRAVPPAPTTRHISNRELGAQTGKSTLPLLSCLEANIPRIEGLDAPSGKKLSRCAGHTFNGKRCTNTVSPHRYFCKNCS